jgi:hypothetical protein
VAKKKKNIDDDEEEYSNVPLTEEEQKKIRIKKEVHKLREQYSDKSVIVTKSGEIKYSDKLTAEEQIEEFIRCFEDPIYFIETYLTVFDQTKGESGQIVPFKLFEFQKDLIRAYKNNKFNVANKYRQAGVSTTTCAFLAWYVMFNKNRYVAVAADKLETARDELMSDVIDFIDCCPPYLRPKIDGKDAATHKQYSNKSEIKAFATNRFRGITPTLLFWDETAHAEQGEKFWLAAAPAVRSTNGNVIFVSTPNGMDPFFYTTFDLAIKKENDFNAIELWWYNDPRYNKELVWIKNKGKENELTIKDQNFSFVKRKQMINDGFSPSSPWFEKAKKGYNGDMKKLAQEIECNFLGSGHLFIAEEYIKRIADNEKRDPIREELDNGNMWIFEDPLPNEVYVISSDVSSGHGDDFSAINIFKVKEVPEKVVIVEQGRTLTRNIKKRKVEQVAEYYSKITPQALAEVIYTYGKKYNFALAVVDVNGTGLGTMEKLLELGYGNIYYSEVQHRDTRDRLAGYLKTRKKEIAPGNYIDVDTIPGFFITTANRQLILQNFELCIRMETVIIRSKRMIAELKTFLTIGGSRLAEHSRSGHDDDIFSMVIGLEVICNSPFNIHQDVEKTKKILDIIAGSGPPVQSPNPPTREAALLYNQYAWLFKK